MRPLALLVLAAALTGCVRYAYRSTKDRYRQHFAGFWDPAVFELYRTILEGDVDAIRAHQGLVFELRDDRQAAGPGAKMCQSWAGPSWSTVTRAKSSSTGVSPRRG